MEEAVFIKATIDIICKDSLSVHRGGMIFKTHALESLSGGRMPNPASSKLCNPTYDT